MRKTKRYRCLFLACWAVLLCAAAPADEGDAILMDSVAAYANEHIITVGDVIEAMGSQRAALMQQFSGDELRTRMREAYRDACNALVDRRLMIDAFNAEQGQIPEWAIDQRIEEIVREQFQHDPAKMEEALAQDGKSLDDWRQALRDRMIVQAMISAKVTANVRVGIKEVRARYEADRGSYGTDETATIRMIVLPDDGGKGAKQAADLLTRARAGEDFAALAREFSKGPRAADGGDWGEVDPTSLRREVADAVRQTAAGAVSEVVTSGGFCYLVQVLSKTEARIAPFEDVQADIERELRREESARVRASWLASLRDKGYVKIQELDVF